MTTAKTPGRLPTLRVLALATLLLAGASAPARADDVLRDWGVDDMNKALAAIGATIEPADVSDGAPVILARSRDGLNFAVFGMECAGQGRAARCRGAEFTATFTLESDQAVTDALGRINFAAVSYFRDGPKKLRVTRYMIFDEGITPGNLRVNAEVYVGLANRVRGMLTPPT